MPIESWDPNFVHAPAHSARIGGTINPRGIVLHTTDTLRGTMAAIVRSWTTTPGHGEAAHVIIGWDEVGAGRRSSSPFDHNA